MAAIEYTISSQPPARKLTWKVQPASRTPPPLTFEPPAPRPEEIARRFDDAIAACGNPAIQPRVPSYEAWLGELYDGRLSHPYFNFYPTFMRKTSIMEDGAPPGLEIKERKPPLSALVPKYPTAIPPPPEPPYMPLVDEIVKILDRGGISLKHEGNMKPTEHFGIKNGHGEGFYSKVYGCQKTRESLDFTKELVGFSKDNPDLNFQGKFYTDSIYDIDSHNKLCLYIPFKDLAPVADFLASRKNRFHPVEFNHPAGLHLFPGVSAVIVTGNGGFDEYVANVLHSERTNKSGREIFIETAKRTLEKVPGTKYHFRWLGMKTA